MTVPNTMDVVARHARERARDAFVAAAADVHRCPLTPCPSEALFAALGRVLTLEELRHYHHQYREELHVLGCSAELAAMKAAREPRPRCSHPAEAVRPAKRVPGFVCQLCGAVFQVRAKGEEWES